MSPLISVILPVYNAESTIDEAIKSILNQTYQNFELIIINDGSSDLSKKIIQSYSDSRIKFHNNQINRGLIYTLNKGLELSQGKYIARMDADDISLATRFEKQIDFMENNPDVILLGGQMEFFGNKKGNAYKQPIDDSDIRNALLYYSPFNHPTVIFRNDIIRQNNIKYNENYIHAEDYKFWSDLSLYGKIMNLDEIILKYRVSKEQISCKYKEIQLSTTKKIKRENLNRLFILHNYSFYTEINYSNIKSLVTWLYHTQNKLTKIQKQIILLIYYMSWENRYKFFHFLLTRDIFKIKSVKSAFIIFLDSIGIKKWEWYKI